MRKREYRDYLLDIHNSIKDVESFIEGMTYKEFFLDKKTSNAVIRSLEVMGEAANQMPESYKQRHTSIPWKQMVGMRNKIIHEYFGVDYKVVWDTANKALPKLKPLISELISHEKL